MPARICFIGNSHVASFKTGWDRIPQRSSKISPTFFGAPGDQIKNLDLKGGQLLPQTEAAQKILRITAGGDGVLTISDYDAFVVVGCGFSVLSTIRAYSEHRTIAHKYRTGASYLISDNCFQDAATDSLQNSMAATLIGKLRAVSSSPIALCVQPFPSIRMAKDLAWWGGLADSGDGENIAAVFAKATQSVKLESVSIHPQPKETCVGHVFSKQEYSDGSVRMIAGGTSVSHPEDDYIHMNEIYGAIALEELISSSALSGVMQTL